MKEQSTETGAELRPTWESLEAFARQGVQRLLQQLLEEEVEGVLGRGRYERRDAVDATPGYRNGHGKPRRLSAMTGTITIRRPRVRGLERRFESRLLPLFKRRTEAVGRLLPEPYLHGMAPPPFESTPAPTGSRGSSLMSANRRLTDPREIGPHCHRPAVNKAD
jgi:transposase-like protein